MPISRSSKPIIAITMGDPSGIGPEVTLKALASSKISGLANFLLIGDGFIVKKACRDMGLRLNKAKLLDLSNAGRGSFSYGKISASSGKAALQYIDRAIELFGAGEADAIVTAPINKSSVRASGVPAFEGHTEYFADKTGSSDFAMMFVGKKLKITLVTRHIALHEVARSLSEDKIYRTIRITDRYLRKFFKIRDPKIGVCGINPHAGEGGIFGSEEDDLIAPAIKKARKYIKNITGPVPADVVFYEALNKKFDAVISMYHDQGLIPFKMLYFKDGVNMTIGLPFVRTSPDHGTAFDIAGKGIADPSSMIEAIRLACRLARK